MFDKRYFLTLTEDQCRSRRMLRNYVPADPPNYFDKYVWPMTIKNMKDFQSFHIEGEIGKTTFRESAFFVIVYIFQIILAELIQRKIFLIT